MRSITIMGKACAPDSGFAAQLIIDSQYSYNVNITNPFRRKQEDELELYFEEWQRFPVIDTTVAMRAACSIKDYGTHLFKQVFDCEQSRNEYAMLLEHLNEVVIEIVSPMPDFHALHWEALWDPGRSRPLAVECIMVRRSLEEALPPMPTDSSPVLNLLVVVARPHRERDVGYRTISRPVVEAVHAGKLRVNVELLRPGTFKALSEQLEARGPGYYHIAHFDCHGALLDYEQARSVLNYDAEQQHRRYGRKPLGRYKGVKAFLMMEGMGAGAVDLVKAPELAKLLMRAKVPVCILNACQSGKQLHPSIDLSKDVVADPTPAYETSLGSSLLNKGLQVVVAMAYRVTVSAAQVMMKELYSQLCAQRPVLESLQLARLALYNNKFRSSYDNEVIELEDWLLPVVYANQSANLKLCSLEDVQEWERHSASLGSASCFRAPKNGFIGRDLDILKVEAALLQQNGLLLRGMGGTGKTTLLKYLCDWWRITHFAANVFYFGYDERSWTLRQILMGIVKEMCDEQGQHRLQALSDDACEEEVITRLKDSHCILILDNVESITGKKLAKMSTLPQDERERVHGFLGQLVNAQIKVVVGSRCGEGWLADVVGDNMHRLQGLDPESQSVLAQKILERCVHDEIRVAELKQDEDYHHLLKILGGYPLAMEVVLANLEGQTPKQILKGLDEADIHLDVFSDDKDSSILRCVEYSFQSLCPETRPLLVCLVFFDSVLVWATLHLYIKELQESGLFGQFNFAKFDEAVQDAIKWGLLSPNSPLGGDGSESSTLNMHPVFPYFLKIKLGDLDGDQRKALRAAFKIVYCDVADEYLDQLSSMDAEECARGLLLCDFEYENLHRALVMCMEDMESTRIRRCLNEYFYKKADHQSGLQLAILVIRTQSAYTSQYKTDEMKKEIAEAKVHLGQQHFRLKDHQKAQEALEEALAMFQSFKGSSKENRSAIAGVYHDLGNVAQETRASVEARKHYQRSLGINIKIGNRSAQAVTYKQIGNVALDTFDLVQAHYNYQRALDIHTQLGNRYSHALVELQMGTVALKMRDYAEACKKYRRGLGVMIEFGDRHSQARAYHQLGIVAEEMRDFVDARQNYQLALDIMIELGDQHLQAATHFHLGKVAGELCDFAEALQNYQRALDIYTRFDDRHGQGRAYHQMGIVAEWTQDFEEAHQNYQRALDIWIECGDQHAKGCTHHHMGRVAAEMRDFAEARQHCQHALDIWIELGDRHFQAKTYGQMGVVAAQAKDHAAACQNYQRALDFWMEIGDRHQQAIVIHNMGMEAHAMGNFAEARRNYQQAIDIHIDCGDRYAPIHAYYHMGELAHEMKDFVEARENYQRALDISVEIRDRCGQAGIHRRLAGVAGEMEDFAEADENYQRALDIYIELGNRRGQEETQILKRHFGVVKLGWLVSKLCGSNPLHNLSK